MFQWVANVFPTQKIADSEGWAAVWRILFYLLRPRRPFLMRLPYYKARVIPTKGTLTRVLIRRGCWEKELTDRFAGFVHPDGFVIDVGANFGNYALTASNLMRGKGLVIAFEPHTAPFGLLIQNVALQENPVIVAEQMALGAESGELQLITEPGRTQFQ